MLLNINENVPKQNHLSRNPETLLLAAMLLCPAHVYHQFHIMDSFNQNKHVLNQLFFRIHSLIINLVFKVDFCACSPSIRHDTREQQEMCRREMGNDLRSESNQGFYVYSLDRFLSQLHHSIPHYEHFYYDNITSLTAIPGKPTTKLEAI